MLTGCFHRPWFPLIVDGPHRDGVVRLVIADDDSPGGVAMCTDLTALRAQQTPNRQGRVKQRR